MPITAQLHDGTRLEFPDGTDPGVIDRVVKSHLSAPQAPATTRQQVQSSAAGRTLQGARDPIDAGAQMLPRGLEQLTSLFGLAPNKVSGFFGDEAKRVDAMNAGNEADYQASRKATGQEGLDAWRLGGNVISPANAAIAARVPAGVGTLGRIGTGALVGGIGGGLTPVDMADPEKSFAGAKAAQVGLGAITGGVLTPVLGKLGDVAAKWWQSRASNAPATAADVERIARTAISESGQKWENLEPAIQEQMKVQAREALVGAPKGADPTTLLRQQDFNKEGMKGTLGQITRDASQFARERNLRTLPGTGDPLLQRFEQQGQQLQGKVGLLSEGAQEAYPAGQSLLGALKAKDESLRTGVSSAYRAARDAAGKDAEVPMQGLAQAYADVLDSFGDKVPSGVRNQFAKFGLDPAMPSNQKKLFTVEEADKLLKVINDNQGSDRAANTALGNLRNAVKDSITKDAGVEDVFSPARKAAAERFKLQDAVPALKAASEGSVAPDDFVRKFVLNGKTEDVQGMAKILKESSPEAYQQARAQIGAELQKAAFGQNVAGDKAFSPERYSQALKKMGSDKLGAFFSPAEVEQMQRLSRIGAYINSMPNASPVQTSNNWGAIMSVVGKIPGVPAGVGLLSSVKNSVDNQAAVSRSLAAKPPTELTPDQIGLLSQYLSMAGAGGGLLSGQSVK